MKWGSVVCGEHITTQEPEDCPEFKDSLGHLLGSCLKAKNNKRQGKQTNKLNEIWGFSSEQSMLDRPILQIKSSLQLFTVMR